MHEAHQPLQDVRVLELAQIMAGPTCGLMLADLGADVVKVERFPGGDDARGFKGAAPGTEDGLPPGFMILNRGKRSVALDLKRPEGIAALHRLVMEADVLTENFRPGTMERLGIGYEDLRRINPRLIFCSVTGYGGQGPLVGRGGFDLILQAFAGLISVTGEPGRRPVKPGVSIADINAGILAAFGIMAAYIHRLRTGEGQRVETSLLQAAMQQTYWFAAAWFATGAVPGPMGTAHPLVAPYETFPCADGELAIGGANESNWRRLAELLGHPEWLDDPRFQSSGERLANRDVLSELIGGVTRARSRAEWEVLLVDAGIPVGPVQTIGEALDHPQAAAVGMVTDVGHPSGGTMRALGFPINLDSRNIAADRPPPRLGEHTAEVLAEAGLTELEISELLRCRAAFAPSPPSGTAGAHAQEVAMTSKE
ncbi:CoA transferase [Roseomonas pecuniae]|uniref:CoA transferase n=1 Tax=Roseomonas populi TaxID=3121582 RepID=A0ABT1XBB9_9PROT|nr:CoA transferase [Roseomonas pecuniae]MCR0984999.1 CoA transferase [Roseomonas pecuniae]